MRLDLDYPNLKIKLPDYGVYIFDVDSGTGKSYAASIMRRLNEPNMRVLDMSSAYKDILSSSVSKGDIILLDRVDIQPDSIKSLIRAFVLKYRKSCYIICDSKYYSGIRMNFNLVEVEIFPGGVKIVDYMYI